MTIILSILIPTVPSRLNYFYPKIMNHLWNQIEGKYNDCVELIALFDNKKRLIGKKRQEMVDIAQGKYVVFIDDDDRVADDYVEAIINELRANPDVDVLVYNCICRVNNGSDKLCKYGKEFEYGDILGGKEWRGKPAHTMVWKTSIVRNHKYQNMGHGEDVNWVVRATKDVQTQVRIDRVLYWYDANYKTTSETAGLSDNHIKMNILKLINESNKNN